jgi:nucleotide-binding universal stress UspA family protein
MRRILLAVDDSPASLATARAAVQLASECSADVLAVHVLGWPAVPGKEAGRGHGAPRTEAEPPAAAGRAGGAAGPGSGAAVEPDSIAVLRFAADLARRAAVPIEIMAPEGDPAREILDLAAAWPADLIVLGRSAGRRVGQPYIGSKVRHVLEFSDAPVLVVPPPSPR